MKCWPRQLGRFGIMRCSPKRGYEAMSNQVNVVIKSTGAQATQGELKDLTGGVESLGSKLGTMVPQLAAVGAGMAAAFAVKESISAVMTLGAEVNSLSRAMGTSAEQSSKWIFTAQEYGVSADTFQKNVVKLEKGMAGLGDSEDLAFTAGKPLLANLKAIGADGLSTSDTIMKIADKVKELGPGMESTALATQLFGKSGADMLPILLQGSDGIRAMGGEAEKLGLVLDQKTADDIKKATMATREMHAAFEGVQVQIGTALVPAMTGGAEAATKIAVAFNQDVVPAIGSVVDAVGKGVEAFQKLPDSTQQLALGLGAVAIVAPTVISGLTAAGTAVKAFATEELAANAGSLLFVGGVAALALGLDAISQKLSGVSLMDRVFGDASKTEAGNAALAKFNTAVLAEGDHADKTRIAMASLRDTTADFAASSADAAAHQSGLENALLGSDNRIFGFNIGMSDGIDNMKKLEEQTRVAAGTLVAQGVSVQQLHDIYETLPPTLQKVFDDTTHVNDAFSAFQDNVEKEIFSIRSVKTETPDASSAIDDFAKSMSTAKDVTKATDDAIKALTGTFATTNPEVVALSADNAFLQNSIDKIKGSTDTLTAAQQKQVDDMQKEIDANDKVIAGHASNQKALEGATAALKNYIGADGLGGLLTQMGNLKTPEDTQVSVLGSITNAFDHLGSKDVPGAISSFETLRKTLDPAVWKTAADAVGPGVTAAIAAIPDSAAMHAAAIKWVALGGTLTGGIIAGMQADYGRLGMTGEEAIQAALDAAKAKAQTGSPSKLFAAQVGVPLGEGIAAGLKSTTSLVMQQAQAIVAAAMGASQGAIGGYSDPGVKGNPGYTLDPNTGIATMTNATGFLAGQTQASLGYTGAAADVDRANKTASTGTYGPGAGRDDYRTQNADGGHIDVKTGQWVPGTQIVVNFNGPVKGPNEVVDSIRAAGLAVAL